MSNQLKNSRKSIRIMFVITKFDNYSSRYLGFSGVILNWTGSTFETVKYEGQLLAGLSESPEFEEIQKLITSTFKNGVVFPMVSTSDENEKKFKDDEGGTLKTIQKNMALRILSYAVDLGITASKWQSRHHASLLEHHNDDVND